MDSVILKTDVETFTSINKKTLHLIFNYGADQKPIGGFLSVLHNDCYIICGLTIYEDSQTSQKKLTRGGTD